MLNDQENLQREVTLADLRDIDSRGGQIFIYGNGGAGRWLWNTLDEFGVPVNAFLDTDVKKLTFNFGFHTMNIQDVEQRIGVEDLLLIGAVDIHPRSAGNSCKAANYASLSLKLDASVRERQPFGSQFLPVTRCLKQLF